MASPTPAAPARTIPIQNVADGMRVPLQFGTPLAPPRRYNQEANRLKQHPLGTIAAIDLVAKADPELVDIAIGPVYLRP
jgi:hypothetical protein